MTDQLSLTLSVRGVLREVRPADVIAALHRAKCYGRSCAVTTRALCNLLGIPTGQERHLRPIIRQAMRETVAGKAQWMVVNISGIGCFLTDDQADIERWNHANFGAALTLLRECREITPNMINDRRHELMEAIA